MPLLIAVVVVLAAAGVLWWLRRRKGASTPAAPALDPFTIGEPWRHHVQAAQSAQRRYRRIVEATPAGPLRDKLTEIGRQVDRGVVECWQIARRGDELDDAVEQLGGGSLRTRLERATDDATRSSLQAQLGSVDRLKTTRDQADAQLLLLNTRLGEVLAGAAEISVASSGSGATDELGTAVDDVVEQLEALRLAVQDVDAVTRPAPIPAEIEQAAQRAADPQPQPLPPPATGQADPGQTDPGQSSPAT
jgi:hypothetical protein